MVFYIQIGDPRDVGFAVRVVVPGCGFSCARVSLFDNFDGWID